ncbi:hypothetical protein M3Y94_00916300 [Aphelenchoides besseyi]|nr:hypothetical protein M3Y94_00916300 [Aphelenchoides besseyi]KAI6223231.1 hypothetical protein M3Y95_00867600 [Aphelenchoides besseyi]
MFRLNATSDASAKPIPLLELPGRSVKSDSSLYVRPDYSYDEDDAIVLEDEKSHLSTSDLYPPTCSFDSNDDKKAKSSNAGNSAADFTAFFTPSTFSSNTNSTTSTDLMTVYPSNSSLKSSLNLSSDIKPVNKANQLVNQLRDMTSRLKEAVNLLANGLEHKKSERSGISKKPGEIKQSIVRRIALKSANGHEFMGNLKTNSLSEHVKLLEMIVDDYVHLNKFIAQHSSSV